MQVNTVVLLPVSSGLTELTVNHFLVCSLHFGLTVQFTVTNSESFSIFFASCIHQFIRDQFTVTNSEVCSVYMRISSSYLTNIGNFSLF